MRFDKLITLRGMESRPLEPNQYDYYKKWHHAAIRSLLTFYDFRGDYEALAARIHPPISVEEAKESLELLEKTGIICKNADGKFEVMGPPITTGEKWQSTAIRNFQQESIELALQSLVRDPKPVRDISTVTVALKFADLEEITARIKELRQSIMHLMVDSGEPDCVYQINFQAFPMTRVLPEPKDPKEPKTVPAAKEKGKS